MSEPPEPNPDGSYHLSPEQILELRSYFEALKQPDITRESRLQYITEALSKLPTPTQIKEAQKKYNDHIDKQILEHEERYYPKPPPPELIALEKALKERYEKDCHLLGQSHKAEMKGLMSEEKYLDLTDRHAKERDKLEATYRNDLKRHIQEAKDSQKLIKEMEERERTLKPDAPQRSI